MLRPWIRKHKRYLLAIVASAMMIAWLVLPSLMSMLRRTEQPRGTINGREVTASRMREGALTTQFLMQMVTGMQKLRMDMFQLQASPDAMSEDRMQNLRVQFTTMAGLLQALDIRHQEILYLVKEDRQTAELSQSEVWRYLVLLYEAEDAGIDASPGEIDQRIESLRSLSENPTVDWWMVDRLLGQLAEREDYLRVIIGHMIEVSKLVEFRLQTIPVTSPELWAQFQFQNDQAKVRFVEFRPEWFRSLIEPTEDELKEFYQAHKDTIPDPQAGTIGYKAPKKAKVACAVARYEDYRDQVEVTDEEIKTYYEENKSEFVKPEEPEQAGEGEMPEVPVPQTEEGAEAEPESGNQAGAEAEGNDQPEEEGAPLPTSQAKPEEEGGTTKEKPATGADQPEEGEQATAAEGQDAGTEESGEETKEEDKPEYKPLSEVRDQIKETLIERKAREAAMEAADKVMQDLQDASDEFINEPLPLEQMARRYNLEYRLISDEQGNQYLSRGDVGQIVPQVRQLPRFALDNTIHVPQQFQSSDGVRVCQVLDRRQPQVQPFEQVRNRVLADYRLHKALDKAEDLAAKLVESAEESSLQEAVAQMNTRLESLIPEEDQPKRQQPDEGDGESTEEGEETEDEKKEPGKILQIEESDLFSRSNPRLSSMGGRRSKVVEKALSMDTGARASVVDGQNPSVCYVIEKLEHKAATAKDYYDQKNYLQRSYSGQKQARLLDDWMETLVASSDMTPEEELKENEEEQQEEDEDTTQRAGQL